MNLYIETENGQVKNHPAFEDNLIQAFGEIPSNWELFNRIERPALELYQVLESNSSTYQKIDGVWSDVWSVRNMTAEEKAAFHQEAKDAWASLPNRNNFSAWTFDESTCTYQPPIPRPETGTYFWQGSTLSWVVRPEYPTDGKTYQLDFDSAVWVEVPSQ